MPDIPVQSPIMPSTTPPASHPPIPPPTTPPSPPAIPVTPPPAATPPTPPIPPVAPPVMKPPASTPPPAPTHELERHNPSRIGPLIAIFVLILAACALLFLKNPWVNLFPPAIPSPTPAAPIVTPPLAVPSTSEVPATTEIATTTPITATPTPVATPTHTLGDTVQFFLNNDEAFRDAKNPKRTFTVTAVEFTDSRCPKGVTCVWQGERGVRLRATDGRTGQSEDVSLGMVRTRAASALGLRFTLRDIVDEKGGTVATATVQ